MYLIPSLNQRFLAYGARASISSSSAEKEKAAQKKETHGWLKRVLDRVAQIQVPHSWFTHFYILSVSCSLLWAVEILRDGALYKTAVSFVDPSRASMNIHQVMLTWLLVLAQVTRRLLECLVLSRPSTSTMWIGHWVLGLLFYAGLSVAVWIEGVPALQEHRFSFKDLNVIGLAPSLRTFIAVLAFLFPSGIQHDCHAYLSSLKRSAAGSANDAGSKEAEDYKLPAHPAFHQLIAPHYFAECLIYLSLTVLATPKGDIERGTTGQWVNWTMASALVFVIVNLGVTADSTKRWYEQRFGRAAVKGRWRMIPWLW